MGVVKRDTGSMPMMMKEGVGVGRKTTVICGSLG